MRQKDRPVPSVKKKKQNKTVQNIGTNSSSKYAYI